MTLVVFTLVIAVPTILIIGGAISQAAYLFSSLTVKGLEFSLEGIDTWVEDAILFVCAWSETLKIASERGCLCSLCHRSSYFYSSDRSYKIKQLDEKSSSCIDGQSRRDQVLRRVTTRGLVLRILFSNYRSTSWFY